MARTDTLGNFLTDVADAIREKKGTEETIQASDFDTEIANLPSGGDISEYFNTNISSYRNGGGNIPRLSDIILKKVPNIIIDNNVTDLGSSFFRCYAEEIENVTFGNNITSLSTCFKECPNLKIINLSGADTSNVTNFFHMFYGDNKLETLNINNFITTSATTMQRMFSSCSSLISLDLSNWETPNLTNTEGMFVGCSSLMHLDIRKMTFNNVSTDSSSCGYMFVNIPQDCEIIVKSQTEKDWVLARRHNLTNVKTVAEYEAE